MKIKRHLDWKIEFNIGFLRFYNPPGNEMTIEFFNQLRLLTLSIIPESKVKAIIVLGSGRHFSSGASLDELFEEITKEPSERIAVPLLSNFEPLNSNLETFNFFRQLNIPTIAAMRGVSIGVALEFAMFCHFRICAEGAVIGLPESTYGLIPGIGGIQNLLNLAGQAKAIEMVLKGNTISAKQALKNNIVDYIVPKKDLIEVAVKLAELSAPNYKYYSKNDYLAQLMIDK